MVNLNYTAANLSALSAHPALGKTMTRLDQISANLADLSAKLKTDIGIMTGELKGQVPAILGNAASATAQLDVICSDLAVLSTQLKDLPVASTMANVEATTGNLKRLTEQVNNPDGTLGKLMNDPQLYNQLNRVTADIDSLIVDIKKNPKRYISIKLL